MVGIYKITNPKGKIYIGQSVDIERRHKEHKYLNSHKKQTKLYNSFIKYGIENHNFDVLEECTSEQLNELELYWIYYYNSVINGLNIRIGSANGYLSEETRNKISEALKGRKNTWTIKEETREKISQSLKEYYKNPESREKISQSLKKHYNSIDFIPPKPLSLPLNQILEIKEKYNNYKISISQLSREYNINWVTVKSIIKECGPYKKEKIEYHKNHPYEPRLKLDNSNRKERKTVKNTWTKPKFSFSESEIIRNKFSNQNFTMKDLAKEYKVSLDTIKSIIGKKDGYSCELV